MSKRPGRLHARFPSALRHLRRVLCVAVGWLICSALVAAQSTSDTESLRKLNSSVEALVRKVSPSVVQILVTGYGALEQSERGKTGVVVGRQRAIGSGFIIDSSGYIITNAHVISGAQRVQVIPPIPSRDDTPAHTLAYRG